MTKTCFVFRETGKCGFGDACKFLHAEQKDEATEQINKTSKKYSSSGGMKEKMKKRPPRATTQALQSSPLSPEEKFFVSTQQQLDRSAESRKTKCEDCWLSLLPPVKCICARLHPLNFTTDVHFDIFLHNKEWYNAGDDAKVLQCCAKEKTQSFVYGIKGDHVKLEQHLLAHHANTLLLYPSETAITSQEFVQRYFSAGSGNTTAAEDGKCSTNSTIATTSTSTSNTSNNRSTLHILVLNGTWSQVKTMRRWVDKFIDTHKIYIPHVKLLPGSLQYWEQRGQQSVYKRKQGNDTNVCTVEAVALLLRELGEDQKVCDSLIDYVVVNNEAISNTPNPASVRSQKKQHIAELAARCVSTGTESTEHKTAKKTEETDL